MATEMSKSLEDLEIDAEDALTNPKAFIDRMVAKSKELGAQLDARNTMAEHEKLFKEKAFKNIPAKEKAQEVFETIYQLVSEQEPDVLVNLMQMFPEVLQMANSSVRSMSMRSGNVTSLSKRQINLLYIKLKNTYETYIQFMKLFHANDIYKQPPVIPPKKGNYSDNSVTSGVKTFLFEIDGEDFVNPFAVARKLDITVKHYMDLPEAITKLLGGEVKGEINGHKVLLKDISKEKE